MFKQHMYGGPKGLGDPNYRELSKMEEDPMIPQVRMEPSHWSSFYFTVL